MKIDFGQDQSRVWNSPSSRCPRNGNVFSGPIISVQSTGAVRGGEGGGRGSSFPVPFKANWRAFPFYRRGLSRKYGRSGQPGCNRRLLGSGFVSLACSSSFGDSLSHLPLQCVLTQQVTRENSHLTPRSSSRSLLNIFSSQELSSAPRAQPQGQPLTADSHWQAS